MLQPAATEHGCQGGKRHAGDCRKARSSDHLTSGYQSYHYVIFPFGTLPQLKAAMQEFMRQTA